VGRPERTARRHAPGRDAPRSATCRRSRGRARQRGASEGPPADFDPAGARTLLLPLRVRERTVGVLVLLDAAGITFDAARRRLLQALAYYAALAAERVRLAAEAEHADALRQADRLKDALLASVSHDLRTPLTTIKALAHDIGVSGDERAVVIEEEADRLNRFVADLLDLSRLAGGALTVAPESTRPTTSWARPCSGSRGRPRAG
jgi:two-component system sensor histidine kinase KdpD